MGIDDLEEKVEPVQCAKGHDQVKMVQSKRKNPMIGYPKAVYMCPTCDRKIRFKKTDFSIKKKVIDEGGV